MMNAKPILLALFSILALFSKAQNVSSQNGTTNQYNDALWLNPDTYVLSETVLEGFFTSSLLSAYHVDDGLIWTQASPDTLEVMSYNELIVLSDSTFGVLGYFQFCCDCTQPEPFLEIRSKTDGSLVDRVGQLISYPIVPTDQSVAQTAWGLAVFGGDWQEESVYYFNHQGDSLTSIPIADNQALLCGFMDYLAVAMENQVLLFDVAGGQVNSIEVPFDAIGVSANEEVLLIQTAEEILGYDAGLNLVGNISMQGGNTTLVSSRETGFVLYDNQYITKISNTFDSIEQIEFNSIQGFEVDDIIAKGERLVLSGAKVSEPFSFMNNRHRHAAFRQTNLDGQTQPWETDLEITGITMVDYQIVSSNEWSVNYTVHANVSVRNDGDAEVSQFYLNSVRGQGICSPEIQHIFIQDVLLPGEESSYTFQGIAGWSLVSASDSSSIDACVFLTNPENEIDNDRDNDSACTSQLISLSVDELNLSQLVTLYPNPASDLIRFDTDLRLESFRIFDAFGRVVKQGTLHQTAEISIGELPGGAYFIRLDSEKGSLMKKLVVRPF
ncbi:MAG TPA: T9SS type A sorting domain-containing protein [Cryomorphaceae bacterium]|nr:T9SS type A sorting domain-containing protein [Cryomorphaceae bacterium]